MSLSLFPAPIQRSLRLKVTLAVLIPLVVILGLFTFIEYRRSQASTLSNYSIIASQAGKVIETNLRQEMVRTDFAGVQQLLDSVQQSQGFRAVYLLNTQGIIIFSSQKQDVGKQLNQTQADCIPCHQLPPDARPASIVVKAADGQRLFRSMNPIENGTACKQCHDPNQRIIGLLLTDISTAPAEASLSSSLRENLIWWAVIVLVTVLVVNFVLDRLVLSRLEKFSRAIQDFGQGQKPVQLSDKQVDEIGNLTAAFVSMADQIETRNIENRALSENLQKQSEQRGELLKSLISAQEDERARVARELHDELGQALSGLSLQAEVMQRYISDDPERAKEQVQQIQALIHETTDCMYDLIIALRPSILDDLGLAAALRAHMERIFTGKDIQFELDTSQFNERLPAELETVLYRTFQEALSNINHHANASKVSIHLSRENHYFVGEIKDNGQGFDPESLQYGENRRGLGIMGMRERISLCSGRLEITSKPGAGTKISISVPIEEIHHD